MWNSFLWKRLVGKRIADNKISKLRFKGHVVSLLVFGMAKIPRRVMVLH